MRIPAVSSHVPSVPTEVSHPSNLKSGGAVNNSDKAPEVARQFEAILMRQFLNESLGPMLSAGGSGGQVYGYYVTEGLADSLTKGGGMGLSSILQTQLSQDHPTP